MNQQQHQSRLEEIKVQGALRLSTQLLTPMPPASARRFSSPHTPSALCITFRCCLTEKMIYQMNGRLKQRQPANSLFEPKMVWPEHACARLLEAVFF